MRLFVAVVVLLLSQQLAAQPTLELLARQAVGAELRAESQRLQTEATQCLVDTEALWHSWRNNFGVRGGTIEWAQYAGTADAPDAKIRAQRLQAQLFSLVTQAKQVTVDAENLAADVDSESTPERPRLTLLAQRLNAVDAAIGRAQRAYDEARPRLERFIQRQLPQAAPLPRPWHWIYALNDRPRMLLRFDADRRYSQALERARQEAWGVFN